MSGVAQLTPETVGDVGRGRVKAAQQHAKALNHRHCGACAICCLEILQGVDHFHCARYNRVVLHALVIVINLLEHAVNLQSQRLRLFPEVDVLQALGTYNAGLCRNGVKGA